MKYLAAIVLAISITACATTRQPDFGECIYVNPTKPTLYCPYAQ